MELKGAQIVLRPAGAADVARLQRILAQPEVSAWWPMVTADELAGMLVIELNGEVVGAIEYEEETDPDYRHAGIDIFLDPGLRGRGLGVDAVTTLARWLIDERGHHRLTIDPAAANTAAVRAYTKAGFRPVGVLRRYERDHRTGEWRDGLLMDLLAEELGRG